MTRKELEKATYINVSKKQRKKEASKNRKDWTGFRSTYFTDKKKYNRKKFSKNLLTDD